MPSTLAPLPAARIDPAASRPVATRTDANAPSPPTRSPAVALATICGVALAARLLAIASLRAWNHPNPREHRTIARMLVEGRGFSFIDWGVFQATSVQSPPFPFLLAFFFKLFGTATPVAYGGVLLLNAIVGAATCLIAYAMVRAVRGGERVALVTAALVAVWPTQVYATTAVQAITIITACVCAIVCLFYRSVASGRAAPWIGFGLIGCVAALTEPVLLPFMALTGLLILCWRELPVALRVRNAAILFACAMLVLAPWSIRNVLVHGRLVPVKSTFWVNMWKGNNEHASGTDRPVLTDANRDAILIARDDGDATAAAELDATRQYDLLTAEQRAELSGKREVDREAIFGRYAKDYVRAHPLGYARLCGVRLWKTLWVEADNPKAHGLAQYALYWLPRTLLLAITPVGLILAARRRWRLFIPLTIALLALATHTLTIAAARFAFPYEPMQLALVALVIVTAFDRLAARPASVSTGGAA